ncbi:hypothetical protein FEF26_06645 [Nesterenkonia salmonea]|uniref:Uncharacterized protein n=1 Tax=Nesterenkonia salmonea TaxID=1804987 RepID=A0A5R9BCU3_9MICC|nr:hypothetical protein [Nesterenkonia salmonea]TLP98061.1 hypothetical protein FEF26_06645 [Nesterenkonia salmonea]
MIRLFAAVAFTASSVFGGSHADAGAAFEATQETAITVAAAEASELSQVGFISGVFCRVTRTC